ncbi:MAG: hypothetical protein GY841_16110 [FCB group bacterium]|nr:hypothetical protein [FCB group bacterium]
MTVYKFANNAEGYLAASITAVATTFTLATADAEEFPALSASEAFYVHISEGSDYEWVVCASHAASATSIGSLTRGQESTSAQAFSTSAYAKLLLPATVMDVFLQKGSYITCTTTPTGNATYFGEERYDSSATKWYKSTSATGTTWVVLCT